MSADGQEVFFGHLDAPTRQLLDEAERIATDRGLSNLAAEVERIRAEAPVTRN